MIDYHYYWGGGFWTVGRVCGRGHRSRVGVKGQGACLLSAVLGSAVYGLRVLGLGSFGLGSLVRCATGNVLGLAMGRTHQNVGNVINFDTILDVRFDAKRRPGNDFSIIFLIGFGPVKIDDIEDVTNSWADP